MSARHIELWEMTLKPVWMALAAMLAVTPTALMAQTPDNPEVAACKATGLLALKETSPSVRDIVLDPETITVSKANTKIEDTAIRTVIMAEVYLERKETGKSQHFLCIIGDKGKVLLTFFTAR